MEAKLAEFFDREHPTAARRGAEHAIGGRDGPEGNQGYDRASWSRLAELGVLGLTLGGEGAGEGGTRQGDAVVAVEEMGRALYHSPYPDTMMAADLIEQAGGGNGHRELVERIGRGDCALALATRVNGVEDPAQPEPMEGPEEPPGSWRISGSRRFVPFAESVDFLTIVGGSPAAPTVFLVPPDRPGIAFRRQDDVGRGYFYEVAFRDTPVSAQDAVNGTEWVGDGYRLALSRARIRQAAYLVGMSRGAFDLALAYTKERQQFGQKIARFQAITFRLSALATRIEAARLMVHHAAWLADGGEDLRLVVPETLSLAAELAREVTAEAIQMHGAIGVTEDAEPQRYFRWAAVESVRLGTVTQLRQEAMSHLA